jgi:hypothetical protein
MPPLEQLLLSVASARVGLAACRSSCYVGGGGGDTEQPGCSRHSDLLTGQRVRSCSCRTTDTMLSVPPSQ